MGAQQVGRPREAVEAARERAVERLEDARIDDGGAFQRRDVVLRMRRGREGAGDQQGEDERGDAHVGEAW